MILIVLEPNLDLLGSHLFEANYEYFYTSIIVSEVKVKVNWKSWKFVIWS